jgi:arabinogalactan oligomer / maltooligosaccharide transport system substrate-binding protein
MSTRPSRKLNRRSFVRGTAGLCLTALLSACAAPTTTAPAATPAAMPTTLLLWHGWSGAARQVLSQQVELFNRQASGGRVVLQSVPLASLALDLRGAVQAGSGPHLAILPNTWIGDLVADGALLPLEERLKADELKPFLPATLGGAQIVDQNSTHLYGLPLTFNTIALFYNRANLLAAPTDTQSLLTSARGLSAPDADPPIWGLALNLSLDMTLGYLYAFGGRVFDETRQLSLGSTGRAGAERWLAWIHKLSVDQRLFARPDSSIAVDHELKSGRALSTFDWAHQLGTYRSLWGENLGVAPLPLLAETNQPAQASIRSDLLALNARIGAQEREAALAFVRFMATEKAQQALVAANLQPARSVPLLAADPQAAPAAAFRTQAEYGLPMPNGPERGIVEQELRLMLRQVLSGLASPADAVDQADQRIRDRLGLS